MLLRSSGLIGPLIPGLQLVPGIADGSVGPSHCLSGSRFMELNWPCSIKIVARSHRIPQLLCSGSTKPVSPIVGAVGSHHIPHSTYQQRAKDESTRCLSQLIRFVLRTLCRAFMVLTPHNLGDSSLRASL